MAAAKRYRVTATMVVVKIAGAQGGETYLRRGRVLPSTVAAAEVKRLVDRGLVEAVSAKDDKAAGGTDDKAAGGTDEKTAGAAADTAAGGDSTSGS